MQVKASVSAEEFKNGIIYMLYIHIIIGCIFDPFFFQDKCF